MSNQPIQPVADDALLSALADGELTAIEFEEACSVWRGSSSARNTWHQYQLIGDILRSEDLARSSGRDAALFARIQAELALQPVVLAPSPRPEPTLDDAPRSAARHLSRRYATWAWMAPSAVAAGVVLVAGAWILTQSPPDKLAGRVAAEAPLAPVVLAASAVTPAVGEAPVAVLVRGPVVRDVELDRYLAAHKQFSSTSVLGAPSGSLRQVATEASGR